MEVSLRLQHGLLPNPFLGYANRCRYEEGYIYHKVKYGDTLWEIARQYNGVSQRDLMRLNDLSNAREIQVGQYLKIKKKT